MTGGGVGVVSELLLAGVVVLQHWLQKMRVTDEFCQLLLAGVVV